MEQKTTLFHRDFTLVVLGQIISLFGNSILRFALPLYLLKETGSETLFGAVTACAFAPMVILSLVGGILADRVNKRNIMVILDFCTAAIISVFYFLLGKVPSIPLFIIVLMLLYGISGTYQPTVQASIPILVTSDKLTSGNAVINQVNTLSGLLGPVLGGIIFGLKGLYPILSLSIICFFVSAIMEIFIHIPHQKRPRNTSLFKAAGQDLAESFYFVQTQKPVFFSVAFLICAFNFILSAVIIVGTPIIITQFLKMPDTMYGLTQGALAAGGLFGAMAAAAVSNKLKFQSSYLFLSLCAICTAITGLSLLPAFPPLLSYFAVTLMSFIIMGASALFVVPIYTLIQRQTPPQLVGKIMAALIAVAMCGQPAGQAVYGILFDICSSSPWIILIGASAAAFLISLYAKKVFYKLSDD